MLDRGRASTKLGLGGLLDEDCHCCSLKALIFQYALVEMVAWRLLSSGGTHSWAQESWELVRGTGSDGGCVKE
jgi:hypothetical protein